MPRIFSSFLHVLCAHVCFWCSIQSDFCGFYTLWAPSLLVSSSFSPNLHLSGNFMPLSGNATLRKIDVNSDNILFYSIYNRYFHDCSETDGMVPQHGGSGDFFKVWNMDGAPTDMQEQAILVCGSPTLSIRV
ncbi:hypothetical protein B0H16DRAFT_1687814 [Mycena metata]|uniref:Uncharacterized protein n=1 Tax=Mycena metata TaxID=1033252 RepID=A0AAD7JHW7_9AGAR|nr:hypothetical protein B0H16DRAFT_1687814 [Mycena metata]